MKTLMKNKKESSKKDKAKKDVIAYRRSCSVEGTGLSHYILMDRKTR